MVREGLLLEFALFDHVRRVDAGMYVYDTRRMVWPGEEEELVYSRG